MTNDLFDVLGYLRDAGRTDDDIAQLIAVFAEAGANQDLPEHERAFADAAQRSLDGRALGLKPSYVAIMIEAAAVLERRNAPNN